MILQFHMFSLAGSCSEVSCSVDWALAGLGWPQLEQLLCPTWPLLLQQGSLACSHKFLKEK